MTAIDLLDTDTERALRQAVRALLRQRLEPPQITASYDEPTDFGPLWKALAVDLGAAGLLVPEDYGGAGASLREVAVVAEEIGHACAPVPFLTSSVIATSILLDAPRPDLLTALSAGEATAALAVPFAADALPEPTVTATQTGLSGTITTVADAASAQLLLVPARTNHGIELHAVRPNSTMTITSVAALDMTRPLADLTFDASPSTLIPVTDLAATVDRALLAGAIALASEQVGLARWCLNTTLDHVTQRIQFGRPIGSFQAIKHRLADLWVDIDQAEAAAHHAAAVHGQGEDYEIAIAAAVAQSYCASTAVHAAEECLQLHGGIGMTWEHPTHLYLKRAKAGELALGRPHQHRQRLSRLIDLPAS